MSSPCLSLDEIIASIRFRLAAAAAEERCRRFISSFFTTGACGNVVSHASDNREVKSLAEEMRRSSPCQ
ncbi:MAG: hypothetical protein DDT32_01866 [Syntrophomonadaceae bacterium]|nr:hypothetical protein [Bacillota bacterium]